VVQGTAGDRRAPLWRRPLAVRLAKFTAGSAIAAVVSELAFIVVYGLLGAGTRLAGVVAFLAGAIPNWALNRRWTWQRRGRPRFGREVLPYVAVVIATAVAATAFSGLADDWVRGLATPRSVQVALVGMAYLLPYGALFLLKFVLFERVVFSGPSAQSPEAAPRVGSAE
jgi:putative flippase GtrA